MFNQDTREKIRRSGFYGYEIAKAMGLHETSFSRLMARQELTDSQKQSVDDAISSLRAGRCGNATQED